MSVTDRVDTDVPEIGLSQLDDVALLDLTRRGSQTSYAVLYERHVYAARRLARVLGQREESDDVVSESFAQVLDLLQRGKGPDRAFRAYLFTAIRHESGRRAKAGKRVMPTDDEATIDTAVPFAGGGLDEFEKNAIRAAYESLPERWRTVLWHLDVEGCKPQDLAPLLGLKPNSVSALVYRARAGLREAYLQQHLRTTDVSDRGLCHDVRGLLASVVRRTASTRDQEKVHGHLNTCDACVAVYLDLQEVNRQVGAVVAPVAFAAAVSGTGLIVATHLGPAVLAVLAKGVLIAAAAPVATTALSAATVVGGGSHDADHAVAEVSTAPAAAVASRTPHVQLDTVAEAGPERARAAHEPLVVTKRYVQQP